MNKLNVFKKFILAATVGVLAISCSDDDSKQAPEKATTKYIVAFEENAVGDADPVDYILEFSSLDDLKKGTIDVKGKGLTQIGWRFFHQTENTLFSGGSYKNVDCIAYDINDKDEFSKKSSFTFDSSLDCYASTEDGKMISVELSYSGLGKKRFHIVNPTTGKLERIVEHEIDIDKGDGTEENPGSIPWVTGMIQRGDKLFVSYHKWVADGSYNTPDTDRAYVAIFKYPEFELEKIIYDSRTSPIGVNGHNTGIVKTENNDIYSSSSSALSAGFTSASKPSGILRIKNGSTEFDSNYFFDVENAENGGKLFWMDYVGNGKAIARIILDDNKGKYEWGSFLTNDAFKLVILDLNNKTVTDISGIPNPNGQRYTAPIHKENGKVYISVSDKTETRIYEVDPITATATKGAKADNAKSIKGIFKLVKTSK